MDKENNFDQKLAKIAAKEKHDTTFAELDQLEDELNLDDNKQVTPEPSPESEAPLEKTVDKISDQILMPPLAEELTNSENPEENINPFLFAKKSE